MRRAAATRALAAIIFGAVAAGGACAASNDATPRAVTDAVGAVAAVRGRGCGDRPAVTTRLVRSARLDRVAEQLGPGIPLAQALEAAHYDARASTFLALPAPRAGLDVDFEALLASRFCTEVADGAWSAIGAAADAASVRLVLSDPIHLPTAADTPRLRAAVLALVNAARSESRRCGAVLLPPAPPLLASRPLDQVAARYAGEMAAGGPFAHVGADGRSAAQRVADGGYAARASGENLALGPTTADEVVAGWLASPGHCSNLMNPRFAEMGLGIAVSARPAPRVYWTQLFATPTR
jgi:uncharacterized protein YkwD